MYIQNNNICTHVAILLKKKDIGSSVSCNVTCLTVLSINNKIIRFYLSIETLNKTNFKKSKLGDNINMEKSLRFGSEISGHYLQGHIDTVGKIKNIKIIDNTWLIKIIFYKNGRCVCFGNKISNKNSKYCYCK